MFTNHYNEYSLSKICGDMSKFYMEIALDRVEEISDKVTLL